MTDIIDAHLSWMTAEHYATATQRDRRRLLLHAHAHLPHSLDDVHPDELATFLANPSWSRWTAHTYATHLVGFYRWAYLSGWLDSDPTATLRTPPSGLTRPKPVTAAELHHALAHTGEPWITCLMLALCAGLRSSELAVIRREDITAEFVHVVCGKGGKERYVDTCASLWAFLAGRPPGLLVRRADGSGVTPLWISHRQHRHWRAIGLPGWHLHRLRHTFCTAMWQAGRDPLAIRDLMGHVSIATTQGYSLVGHDRRRQAVSAIDDLLASWASRDDGA